MNFQAKSTRRSVNLSAILLRRLKAETNCNAIFWGKNHPGAEAVPLRFRGSQMSKKSDLLTDIKRFSREFYCNLGWLYKQGTIYLNVIMCQRVFLQYQPDFPYKKTFFVKSLYSGCL